MRIALFGATGGIGRCVLEQALGAGHDVTVLTRDPGKLADPAAGDRLRAVVGDIEQYGSVLAVVVGSDAVVSALGPTRNAVDQVELFARWAGHLVESMEAHGPARVVILSGAAVDVPGERKALGDRIASAVVQSSSAMSWRPNRRSSTSSRAADWSGSRYDPRAWCPDRAPGGTSRARTCAWGRAPGSASLTGRSSCCAR